MDSLHNVGGAMNFRPEQHQTDEHADGQMRIPPLPSCADASPARHLSFSSVSPRTTTTLSISSPALFAPGHQSEILNKKDVEEVGSGIGRRAAPKTTYTCKQHIDVLVETTLFNVSIPNIHF